MKYKCDIQQFGVYMFHTIVLMQANQLRDVRCVGMMLGVSTFLALTDHPGDS